MLVAQLKPGKDIDQVSIQQQIDRIFVPSGEVQRLDRLHDIAEIAERSGVLVGRAGPTREVVGNLSPRFSPSGSGLTLDSRDGPFRGCAPAWRSRRTAWGRHWSRRGSG